jgi:hypothetical protein
VVPTKDEVAFRPGWNYDRQYAPRYVLRIAHAKIEYFDKAMGHLGSDFPP